MISEELRDVFCNNQCGHYDHINQFCWLMWWDIKEEDLCHVGFKEDSNGFYVIPKK
jgi:hypothetical protein